MDLLLSLFSYTIIRLICGSHLIANGETLAFCLNWPCLDLAVGPSL